MLTVDCLCRDAFELGLRYCWGQQVVYIAWESKH
jgi:hypothetical protein